MVHSLTISGPVVSIQVTWVWFNHNTPPYSQLTHTRTHAHTHMHTHTKDDYYSLTHHFGWLSNHSYTFSLIQSMACPNKFSINTAINGFLWSFLQIYNHLCTDTHTTHVRIHIHACTHTLYSHLFQIFFHQTV